MVKAVAKKGKRSEAAMAKYAEVRQKVIKLLLRKNGASLEELKEAGHNQPAALVLKLAQNRGLKAWSDKAEGEYTRYYATGTPVEPTRGRVPGTRVGAKKAKVAKKAKPAKTAKTAKKAKKAKPAKKAKAKKAAANGAATTATSEETLAA